MVYNADKRIKKRRNRFAKTIKRNALTKQTLNVIPYKATEKLAIIWKSLLQQVSEPKYWEKYSNVRRKVPSQNREERTG